MTNRIALFALALALPLGLTACEGDETTTIEAPDVEATTVDAMDAGYDDSMDDAADAMDDAAGAINEAGDNAAGAIDNAGDSAADAIDGAVDETAEEVDNAMEDAQN